MASNSSSYNEYEDDTKTRITRYRALVQQYETLNEQINILLEANRGGTEHMTQGDLSRYREMARQRDEFFSEMRYLEQQLLDDSAQ